MRQINVKSSPDAKLGLQDLYENATEAVEAGTTESLEAISYFDQFTESLGLVKNRVGGLTYISPIEDTYEILKDENPEE